MTVVNQLELEKELQNFKDLRKITEYDGKDTSWIDTTIAELERQLGRNQERVEQQAAILDAAIQLPQDYDERTGLVGMNDEIQNLIRQALEAVTAVHNADMQQVHAECRQKVVDAESRAAQAEALAKEDKARADALEAAGAQDKQTIFQLGQRAEDAEQKRDNAVRMSEEAEARAEKAERQAESLKTQVDELERMVQSQKKPVTPLGGFAFTSTLKPETDEEKAARLKRLEAERINKNLERFNVPLLRLPTLPGQEEAKSDEAFHGDSQAVGSQDGAGAQQEAVPGDGDASTAGEVAPQAPSVEDRLKDLELRVEALENEKKGMVA